jgi:pimeloyl-ACP methyl ester carboxylesterase
MISRFQIQPDDGMVADLRQRLGRVRWSDAVTEDWSQGTQFALLHQVVAFWRDAYDWEARRTALNALSHQWATTDGFRLHFLHVVSGRSNAVPLLLMNGWPSSFVEFQRLFPLLGAGDPAFDVVVPTHPGFGFSQKLVRPYEVDPVELYPKLMRQLGYDRFAIAGTDIGAGIATRIALKCPQRVMALHISAIASRQTRAGEPPQSEAERDPKGAWRSGCEMKGPTSHCRGRSHRRWPSLWRIRLSEWQAGSLRNSTAGRITVATFSRSGRSRPWSTI